MLERCNVENEIEVLGRHHGAEVVALRLGPSCHPMGPVVLSFLVRGVAGAE